MCHFSSSDVRCTIMLCYLPFRYLFNLCIMYLGLAGKKRALQNINKRNSQSNTHEYGLLVGKIDLDRDMCKVHHRAPNSDVR